MQYGVLCLLPPAAMLIFALKTKKSFEALIFGTLVAYLIMYKAPFVVSVKRKFLLWIFSCSLP